MTICVVYIVFVLTEGEHFFICYSSACKADSELEKIMNLLSSLK